MTTYSGAQTARQGREMLGQALAALQEDPNIPPDVMAVAQNIAQAVGALFEAERASSEPDGKSSIRAALGSLSQTLALLQDVRGQHRGIALATETIAKVMSGLFPLTTVPSRMPPAPAGGGAPQPQIPRAAPVPQGHGFSAPPSHSVPPVQSRGGPREKAEANIGATTESNFYVGFSGEIAEGGVFVATYNTFGRGTPMEVLITLPGGFETKVNGVVRFVRDPMDFGAADNEPGMGIQFEGLGSEARELILRFIRKRPPMFYDE